jgi:hypothetical protein
MGGTNWQEPTISWGNIANVNQTVVIVGGNKVVSAWFSYTDYEVRAMTGEIPSAPPIPPKEIPSPALNVTPTGQPADNVLQTDEPSNPINLTPTQVFEENTPYKEFYYEPMLSVAVAVAITVLLLVVVIWIYKWLLHR